MQPVLDECGNSAQVLGMRERGLMCLMCMREQESRSYPIAPQLTSPVDLILKRSDMKFILEVSTYSLCV